MRYFVITVIALFMISCGSSKKTGNSDFDFTAGPPTLVYKTKADYSKNVPVILSEDKSMIVSYPHMSDLSYKGEMAYPKELDKGYFLDNRGITENVAFLSVTYSEYANFEELPTADELFVLIIDNDPLTELYDCGNRNQWKDPELKLNEIINKKKLKKCKKIVK